MKARTIADDRYINSQLFQKFYDLTFELVAVWRKQPPLGIWMNREPTQLACHGRNWGRFDLNRPRKAAFGSELFNIAIMFTPVLTGPPRQQVIDLMAAGQQSFRQSRIAERTPMTRT